MACPAVPIPTPRTTCLDAADVPGRQVYVPFADLPSRDKYTAITDRKPRHRARVAPRI
jgi:hypothetical protein